MSAGFSAQSPAGVDYIPRPQQSKMGEPLRQEDAHPMKTVSKCREPSRRVYYVAAYEIKKETPIWP